MGVWFFKKTKLHNRFAGWVFPSNSYPIRLVVDAEEMKHIRHICASTLRWSKWQVFISPRCRVFAGIDGKIKHQWWIPGRTTIRSIGSSDQYIVGVRLGSWQNFNKCHLSSCTAKLSGKCQTVCTLHDSPPSVQQFGPFWRCISLVISCCTLLLWKLLMRPWNPYPKP